MTSASESAAWLQRMSECLAAVEREQAGASDCPVVDHELIADFTDGPDDMVVWCICRSTEEKLAFIDTGLTSFASAVKRRMLHAGFPESAVASLTVRATSRGEIEAGGGRFWHFR